MRAYQLEILPLVRAAPEGQILTSVLVDVNRRRYFKYKFSKIGVFFIILCYAQGEGIQRIEAFANLYDCSYIIIVGDSDLCTGALFEMSMVIHVQLKKVINQQNVGQQIVNRGERFRRI